MLVYFSVHNWIGSNDLALVELSSKYNRRLWVVLAKTEQYRIISEL